MGLEDCGLWHSEPSSCGGVCDELLVLGIYVNRFGAFLGETEVVGTAGCQVLLEKRGGVNMWLAVCISLY